MAYCVGSRSTAIMGINMAGAKGGRAQRAGGSQRAAWSACDDYGACVDARGGSSRTLCSSL